MVTTQSQPTMCARSTAMVSMLQRPAVEMGNGQATMNMDFGAIRIQLENQYLNCDSYILKFQSIIWCLSFENIENKYLMKANNYLHIYQ